MILIINCTLKKKKTRIVLLGHNFIEKRVVKKKLLNRKLNVSFPHQSPNHPDLHPLKSAPI